jgi:SSS family solute:Na+ symporter
MIIGTNLYTFLYGFVALIVLVGLLFSRTTGRSTKKYFWAESANKKTVLSLSLFLALFLNALLLMLPGISLHSPYLLSAIVAFIFIVVQLLFGKTLIADARTSFEMSSGFAKIILSIHGVIFVGIVQILVYVQISNYLFEQFFSGTHFGIQVMMIIAAGIYTLAGGLTAVVYANLFVSAAVLGSMLIVLANSLFILNPHFFSFDQVLNTGAELFRLNGTREPNIMIAAAGILCMMLWMVWFELGMINKLSVFTVKQAPVSVMIIAGTIAASAVILVLLTYDQVSQSASFSSPSAGFVNAIIVVSFLGGLIGLFALSFQSFSTIIALSVFPMVKDNHTEEEQILVGRLSTVVIVLLSVLLLSLIKNPGTETIRWYLDFIAFFTMPIAATFIISLIVKGGINGGLLAGLLLGELYAGATFFLGKGFITQSFLHSASVYAVALENIVVTLIVGTAAVRFEGSHIGQRFLLRFGISRPLL